MKKNKKLTILLVIIAIVALIIGVLYVRRSIIYDRTPSEEYAEYYSQVALMPRNILELYGYSGINELNDMYLAMRSFVEYLPRLDKDLNGVESDEELKKFFIENRATVKAYTSINSEEKFVEFVKYIRKSNIHDEIKYAEAVANSSMVKDNYYWCQINFYFGEAKEPLMIDVGLSKSKKVDIVKFDIITKNRGERTEEEQKLVNEILKNDSPSQNADGF